MVDRPTAAWLTDFMVFRSKPQISWHEPIMMKATELREGMVIRIDPGQMGFVVTGVEFTEGNWRKYPRFKLSTRQLDRWGGYFGLGQIDPEINYYDDVTVVGTLIR